MRNRTHFPNHKLAKSTTIMWLLIDLKYVSLLPYLSMLSIDHASSIISRGRGHGEWAEPPPYEGGPPERFPPEPPTPTDTG